MSKIRIGVVGCGRVAFHHANMMREIPEIQLVAACDIKADRAEAFGKEYGIPTYADYHQMLAKHDVDVVSIITPSGMHPFHVLDVINTYKKHVIVEKPIVLNLADAFAIVDAAKKNGVKIFPIYQNRYNKAMQRVKHAVDGGEFGRIAMGSMRVHWCRPQPYYDRDPWRGTWAMDGGALTNQGIHYLDLLQWCVGPVKSVYAKKATQFVKVEVEDSVVGVVTFENGAMGTVEVTTAARPKDFEASIAILGEKGSAIVAGVAANELKEFTLKPEDCQAHSEVFPTVYGFGHKLLIQNVALDLLGKGNYPINMDDAIYSIRLLNALYASAETGKEVFLKDGVNSELLGRRDPKLEALYTTPKK